MGFRSHFEVQLDATATSIKVVRGRGGNARSIVEHAIKEKIKFKPVRKFGDRVYLVMDTEGPGRVPELRFAETLARKNDIEIVYSSPSIEYWFLCHFPSVPRRTFKDCDSVITELDKKGRWASICNSAYSKSDPIIFARLLNTFNYARIQALKIDLHHLSTVKAARSTNPSTQVYELIAELIGAISGEMCPMSGTWFLVDQPKIAIQSTKGSIMPLHDEKTAHWRR